MKKGVIHILLVLAFGLATAPQAFAQGVDEFVEGVSTDKRAQTGFSFLGISPAARVAAMGDATTAFEQPSSIAMFYNPAAMARLTQFHVAVGRTSWIADIDYNMGSIAFNPAGGRYGVVGLSVMSVDYGEFFGTVVDESAPNGYRDFSELGLANPTPTALAVGVGYAKALTDRFAVGGQAKYARQNLGTAPTGSGETSDYDESTVAFDFGVLYNTGYRSLNIAMSARNFAQEITYVQDNFELPLTFRIGASMNLMDFTTMDRNMHSLIFAVDAVRPRDFDENVRIGGEYTFMNLLSLRAGYSFPTDEQGISLGAGLRPSVSNFAFGVDYAYTTFGVFDAVHRIGINLGF